MGATRSQSPRLLVLVVLPAVTGLVPTKTALTTFSERRATSGDLAPRIGWCCPWSTWFLSSGRGHRGDRGGRTGSVAFRLVTQVCRSVGGCGLVVFSVAPHRSPS